MIDPQQVPRFAGVPTFMRMSTDTDLDSPSPDAAFIGIPFDDATTYRPGARFGPRAIRNASSLLKPYNPVTDVNLQEYEIVDHDWSGKPHPHESPKEVRTNPQVASVGR